MRTSPDTATSPDGALLRGPGALAATTGGQRRADILPRVGALVYVVLDVDADGVRLLGRPRAGRSSWRICRRSFGRRGGTAARAAQFRRGSGGPSPDGVRTSELKTVWDTKSCRWARSTGARADSGVIGQAQQSPERLACGRSLARPGRRRGTALGRNGREAGASARTAHLAGWQKASKALNAESLRYKAAKCMAGGHHRKPRQKASTQTVLIVLGR